MTGEQHLWRQSIELATDTSLTGEAIHVRYELADREAEWAIQSIGTFQRALDLFTSSPGRKLCTTVATETHLGLRQSSIDRNMAFLVTFPLRRLP